MNSLSRNSIVLVIILLVEAIILKLAKSIRLWIYIALPIIAGFTALELLKSKPAIKIVIPRSIPKKRVLK